MSGRHSNPPIEANCCLTPEEVLLYRGQSFLVYMFEHISGVLTSIPKLKPEKVEENNLLSELEFEVP